MAYCTKRDLENRMSASGVDLRIDDRPEDELGNVLEHAATKVNMYLMRQYDEAAMATSEIVKDFAIAVALYLLCTRRGNPAPDCIVDEYKETIEDMKAIRRGEMEVPDIAARRQSAPVMDNVRVRLRPQPHPVVNRSRSTTAGGKPQGYTQHNDRYEPESSLTHPTG